MKKFPVELVVCFIVFNASATCRAQQLPRAPAERAASTSAERAASGPVERATSLPVETPGGSPTLPPGGASGALSFVEITLSIGVLIFGAIIIGLEILVMLKREMYWENWSFRVIGLTLVITAGLFLIVAGYTQDQIAPMMGLLGTVAGYLLGKDEVPSGAHKSSASAK